MQKKNFKKLLSIFSAAALLVTQLTAILPVSAAQSDNVRSENTVFTDDFERDTVISASGTESSAVSIEAGKGKNGGKALVVKLADVAANDKGKKNISFVPQNSNGEHLIMEAGKTYKLIVTMTYRMDSDNNPWEQVYLKTQLLNGSYGWHGVFAENCAMGDIVWASRVPYSAKMSSYCLPTSDGGWHTVSFPLTGTNQIDSNGYLYHAFENLGSNGELVIDEISYTVFDESTELKNSDGSTFKVKAGDALNLVVKFSYKTTGDDFQWEKPWIYPAVVGGTAGAYNFSKLTPILLDANWNTLNTTTYYTAFRTGDWVTVSYPVKGTAEYDGDFFLGIDTAQNGNLFIDNVEVTVLPSDMSATAMVMTDSKTDAVNKSFVTAIAGSDISVLPTPEKEGYSFTGWYADTECTQKLTAVPEPIDGAHYVQVYSGWERVKVFTDDFESRDTLNTNATSCIGIQAGKGKNGGKALVIDLANNTANEIQYVPQSADGSRLIIEKDTQSKYIVTMTYRMDKGNAVHAPVGIKFMNLKVSDNGWIGILDNNFNLGDYVWSTRTPNYNACYTGYTSDGEWHTVSFPVNMNGSTVDGYLAHSFANLEKATVGELIIDEITYTLVDNDTELSTVSFNTKGGSTLDYTTVATGTAADSLPVPSKTGFEFAGWYTDEACTVKCETVPANNTYNNPDVESTVCKYVVLYAGWTAATYDANGDGSVDIIDLIVMKKSIANNDGSYNAESLAALKKMLLSDIKTAVTTDKGSYVLTVNEDFDGTELDTELWTATDNSGTADSSGVSVENGLAVLGKNGTACGIRTSDKLMFKHGYIEARVKLPETDKVGSAIWLNHNYATNHKFSEIDIFETFGAQKIVSNVHKWDSTYKKEDGSYANSEEELAYHTDFAASVLSAADVKARERKVDASVFHTVGCEWGEDFVRFYLDGEMYFEINKEKYPDFVEVLNASPLYMILSVGGEDGVTYTNTDKDLYKIDYVRIYQDSANSMLIK